MDLKFANAIGAQSALHDDAIRHTLTWSDGIAEYVSLV